ncbi:MAG: sigma-70 family RNA polymerase sigma factor [Acidobacteria bacterium]|nr:sigma-70 family RNA polymerase sigma factor [Acidobacteriota bacterium]
MIFGSSLTFDDESLGQAVSSVPAAAACLNAEEAFVEKLRSRDAAAFDELVTRYSKDIYAVLVRLISDRDEAADLTQETFLKALRSIGSFRGDCSLRTWLYRIAVNESRNRHRWWKRRRRDSTLSLNTVFPDGETEYWETLSDNSISPEEEVLRRERAERLNGALNKLKPVFREAITLCDIEGLSYEECAATLECSIGTVRSRLSRGREELRKQLKDI